MRRRRLRPLDAPQSIGGCDSRLAVASPRLETRRVELRALTVGTRRWAPLGSERFAGPIRDRSFSLRLRGAIG